MLHPPPPLAALRAWGRPGLHCLAPGGVHTLHTALVARRGVAHLRLLMPLWSTVAPHQPPNTQHLPRHAQVQRGACTTLRPPLPLRVTRPWSWSGPPPIPAEAADVTPGRAQKGHD